MSIPTETYEAVFEHYSAAIQWMDGLGIKLSPGRTSHYERVVRHWKDAYKTASAAEGRDIFPDFVSSMFEIFDFVSVHKAFQHVPSIMTHIYSRKAQKRGKRTHQCGGRNIGIDRCPEFSF